MKAIFSFSLALCGVLLLGACNSVNTVERADPLATPAYIADKRVITDPTLERRVSVLRVNEGKVGDLLRIQIEVENKTYTAQVYNYEFVWIEQDGFQVTSPPPLWKAGQINGRERQFLTAIAPNPRVVDFRLNLLDRQTYNQRTGRPNTGPAGKR